MGAGEPEPEAKAPHAAARVVGPQDPTRSVPGATRAAGSEAAALSEPLPPEIPGFRLITKLGQGGQGSVWLAEHLDGLGKRCALKVFPTEAHASYARELEAWKRVEEIRRGTGTPHLVEGYAASVTEKGIAFVAMAFFERGSLSDRMAADGPFASTAAVRYARHVLAALDLLHQHGLWHRDVKPQNILLGNDGIARLADYGLSKRLGATVTASCTPAFAAPEQLAGEEDADGVKIDIYGVGATLFALLTGKPPVPGRPDVFLLERKKVPRPVHAPLLRALNPDPAQRYARAAEFAQALLAAEPPISGVGPALSEHDGPPPGERAAHEVFVAETRAADPDRPLATPGGPKPRAKSSADPGGSAGRIAAAERPAAAKGAPPSRGARIALFIAAAIFAVGVGLDAFSDRWLNRPDTGGVVDPEPTPQPPPGPGVEHTPLSPIPVSEVAAALSLAPVHGLGAGKGAIALTGSASVWLALPSKTLLLSLDARRAVPWTRDRVLVALPSGDLALAGALGIYPIPSTESVTALAGDARSGRVAFAGPTGIVHTFQLDGLDRVVPRSGFRLPDPEAADDALAHSVVTGLSVDDAGTKLAVASIADPSGSGRVAVYSLGAAPGEATHPPDPPRWAVATVLDIPGPVALAWLSETALAVADVEGTLSVVDARDGALLRRLELPFGTVVSLARSVAGDLLLVLGDDRRIEPEGTPGTVALGERGEVLGGVPLAPKNRLLGFRIDQLLARGAASPVLDTVELR